MPGLFELSVERIAFELGMQTHFENLTAGFSY